MSSRRTFLCSSAATLGWAALSRGQDPPRQKKRLAVVTTDWRDRSHAWHMAERFLAGYPVEGSWHRPPLDVVSAYVDQTPEERPEPASGPRSSASRSTRRSPRPCAAAATSSPSMPC